MKKYVLPELKGMFSSLILGPLGLLTSFIHGVTGGSSWVAGIAFGVLCLAMYLLQAPIWLLVTAGVVSVILCIAVELVDDDE